MPKGYECPECKKHTLHETFKGWHVCTSCGHKEWRPYKKRTWYLKDKGDE